MIDKIRCILGLPFVIVAYICFIPVYIFGSVSCKIYGKDYPFITTNNNKK